MYLNARRHMAALGIQSMFLPTPYGGASIEWVNGNYTHYGLNAIIQFQKWNLEQTKHSLGIFVAVLSQIVVAGR